MKRSRLAIAALLAVMLSLVMLHAPVSARVTKLNPQALNLVSVGSIIKNAVTGATLTVESSAADGITVTVTAWPSSYGSLSDIANTVYGNADLWNKIWQANPSIANPDLILIGQQIFVPNVNSAPAPTPAKPAPAPAPVAPATNWYNPLPGVCFYPNYLENRGTYYHQGNDIPAAYGTAIHAITSGTVQLAGWYGGGGNTIIINHGNGLYSIYMHQSRFAVGQGQWVAAGQVIGYVGSTGDSSGPHLHLEIHPNGSLAYGTVTDPILFLENRGVSGFYRC